MHFLPFPWPINYNHASRCNKSSTHLSSIWFWLKISFSFLEIMASHMVTFYGLRVAQVNEEPTLKSFLDLILTPHPRDEDSKPWEVRTHLEVDPFWAWYYHISPNSHTLIILLQVDPAFGEEPKTIYGGCYKTKQRRHISLCRHSPCC
jgi:hypothetical protein